MLRKLALMAVLLSALNVSAAWDIFQSYATLDYGDGNSFYAGGYNPDLGTTYDGQYYGFFRAGDTFMLNGGELKTFKNGSSNVCGGSIYYRVYKECETPGVFNSVILSFESNLANPGDQRWQTTNAGIDLLSGLTKGDYILEIYWDAIGDDVGGCSEFKYDNNIGSNITAEFTVGTDGFDDGNITTGAVWNGDTTDWSVLDAASTAGNGSNANISAAATRNDATLVSNSTTGDAALILPSTQAYGVWEFSVATGNGWLPSASNNFIVVLSSSSSTAADMKIGSMNFDGYFIKWVSDTSGDFFGLFRQDGLSEASLVSLAYPLLFDAELGYTLKVVRTTDGDWSLYADQGFDNTDATTLRATTRDNVYTTSTSFAVSTNITNTSDARRLYFDNLLMGAGTEVDFAAESVNVTEGDVDGTYDLTFTISDEDDRCATAFDVMLLSGDAARIGSYTTQNVTFPANDNTAQTVSVTITGNTACERNETLVFGIQNTSGGCEANAGIIDTFALHLNDDESGTELMFNENWEDNDLAGWENTTQWETVNSIATISGDYDLRQTQTIAANDYISHTLNSTELRGAETTWNFNLKFGGTETSSNNWVMAVISGSESDAFSATLDGYAVGVNFGTATDNLRLVRIDNGVYTDVITSAYDWSTNIVLGIEVTRDEDGNWELLYEEDGAGLIAAGTALEATYLIADYFSYAAIVTVGNVNKARIDDIKVEQYGCFQDWYSVGNGNSNDNIWSLDNPFGAGGPANFGRFKNVIVQNGNTVALNADVIARNMIIESGASLDGAASDIKTYGDWTNDGSFAASSGSVTMKGNSAQTIGGASSNGFYDLHIENDGSTVSLGGDLDILNVMYPEQGTVDVNGNALTLKSDASGTGSIGAFGNSADLLGNITMERYIPAGGQNWVNIGTALTGLTIADLADDIVTTGFIGSDFPAYGLNNIQKYDETIDGQLNDGWEMTDDISNALENDRGYMILMLDAAQGIDLTGGIQKGSYSQPINYNAFQGATIDGWNLVTNRYPSEIDWDAIVALSTNVSTYYVSDAESGTYLSRNGNTQVGSASRYIASNQSFWVKADALGAILQWEESVKSSSGQAFERSMEAASFISLKIEGEGFENSAFFSFAEGATASYENAYDAHKLGSINSASAEISTLDIDGLNMANNTLGSIESNVSIQVQLVAGTAGTYTFSIDETSGIPATSCISIENTATGIISPLSDNATWTVELDVNEVNTQFIIHLSAPVTSEIAPISCFGSDDASIELLAPGNGPWNVTWFNEVDFEIGSEEFTSSTVLENLPMGNYLAVLTNSDLACASVQQVFMIDEIPVQTFSKTSEAGSCDWIADGWIELEVANATSMNIMLSFEGNEIFNSAVEGNNFVIDGLESGNYTATVETACISVSESIELFDLNAVTIVTPEQITVALENGLAPVALTAEAENATDIVWFENGLDLGTGSTLNVSLTEVGNYLFTAIASNETCSAAGQTLVIIDNVVAVDELEDNLQFYASTNGMELVSGQAMENLRFELFNIQGQLIQSERLKSAEGQQTISLNGIAAGSYLATLTSNGVVVAVVKIVR
jgi:hypothetical protein